MSGAADAVLSAVETAVEAHRPTLDDAIGLEAVTVVVKLDKAGRVREIILRTEHHHGRSGLC